jgi:hypothetical protein
VAELCNGSLRTAHEPASVELLIRGFRRSALGEPLGPLWDHTVCTRLNNPHVGALSAGPSLPH